MGTSFAGVALNRIDQAWAARIFYNIPQHEIYQFKRHNWQPSYPVHINQLQWPTWGSRRHAIANFIVTEDRLNLIRDEVFTPDSVDRKLLVMDDERSGQKIEVLMHWQNALPLERYDPDARGLWLLTLVDGRYFFYDRINTLYGSAPPATWDALLNQIATALSINLEIEEPIPAAYLTPSDDFVKRVQSLPTLLDWAASSVGCRVVYTLTGGGVSPGEGRVILRRGQAARTSQEQQFNLWNKRGGGTYNTDQATDLRAQVMNQVDVIFPDATSGLFDGTYHTESILLSQVQNNIPHMNNLTPIPGVMNIRASRRYVNGENNAEVNALAVQAATDYWLWQSSMLDIQYNNFVPYVPTGLESRIDFDDAELVTRLGTRVARGPGKDYYHDNEDRHDPGDPDNPLPEIPAVDPIIGFPVINVGIINVDILNAITINVDILNVNQFRFEYGDAIHCVDVRWTGTADLSNWNFDPANNTLTNIVNGALLPADIDDSTPRIGRSILLLHNNEFTDVGGQGQAAGVYVVTQVGSETTPTILTRREDLDETVEYKPGCLVVYVTSGTQHTNEVWRLEGTIDPDFNWILNSSIQIWFLCACGGEVEVNGHIIQDEGIDLPQQPRLNFIGPNVTATDNPATNTTDVTITGGDSNYAHSKGVINSPPINVGDKIEYAAPSVSNGVTFANNTDYTLPADGVYLLQSVLVPRVSSLSSGQQWKFEYRWYRATGGADAALGNVGTQQSDEYGGSGFGHESGPVASAIVTTAGAPVTVFCKADTVNGPNLETEVNGSFATITSIGGSGGGGGGGEANTQTNLGGGTELGLPKAGVDLPLRTFEDTATVTWAVNGNVIRATAVGGGGGEANTQTNQGGAVALGLPKAGVDLPLKTIIAGTNTTITEQAQTITINVPTIGATTFIGLTDTPANYGTAFQFPRLNFFANALEWVNFDFIELVDTPNDYTGQAGKTLIVNQTENALEFADSASGDIYPHEGQWTYNNSTASPPANGEIRFDNDPLMASIIRIANESLNGSRGGTLADLAVGDKILLTSATNVNIYYHFQITSATSITGAWEYGITLVNAVNSLQNNERVMLNFDRKGSGSGGWPVDDSTFKVVNTADNSKERIWSLAQQPTAQTKTTTMPMGNIDWHTNSAIGMVLETDGAGNWNPSYNRRSGIQNDFSNGGDLTPAWDTTVIRLNTTLTLTTQVFTLLAGAYVGQTLAVEKVNVGRAQVNLTGGGSVLFLHDQECLVVNWNGATWQPLALSVFPATCTYQDTQDITYPEAVVNKVTTWNNVIQDSTGGYMTTAADGVIVPRSGTYSIFYQNWLTSIVGTFTVVYPYISSTKTPGNYHTATVGPIGVPVSGGNIGWQQGGWAVNEKMEANIFFQTTGASGARHGGGTSVTSPIMIVTEII